ncbi:efflux RND transporter permease subunit [Paraliomyxa miuraensis]|uniref:efflux RND transporter permease subunit n=1 Tax=Paraliomyxa miuraensis TaxID=376150 RepID=UPI0022520CCB|nr:efflux RND transporter permease subunit [Paraliomyxa miuraensis]MCX4240092.1 efflux RND transporter permease subunit [Paraliomyxa miuraensis]
MTPALSDSGIVRLSLRRPITMVMVLLSAIVLGFVALARIPLELIPSGFSPPFMSVTVPYADATAKDVEEKITQLIEGAVSTTPGVDEITSISSAGNARVVMTFKSKTDMDVAYREVRDRVARVRPDLPDDVRVVNIRKESGASLPVAFYGIIWDEEIADPAALIDKHLARPIERIDGVGVVNLLGRTQPEVYIEVDRALADAAGVEMVDLVQRLAQANFTMASGTVQDRDGKYLLRSLASFDRVEEIGEVVVSPQGLRLREIAQIDMRPPDVERYDRYNGHPSLVMAVVKESQANTVEVSDAIKAAIEEATLHPDLKQFTIEKIFIQGDTIRFSLDQVIDSGKQGGLLAIFVLLFFLRRLRLTLIISLAIPLSLFLSLPVMYFSGQTINLVSLIGLMICIGLVVDNSVVVAENIGRFRRRGLGPYAAALQGTGEVALAITLATMTTIVVFLPAALLSDGPTQFFMVRMVTPVCVSLLASLFVAVVLVPLASVTALGDDDASRVRRQDGVVGVLHRADALWKAVLERAYEATFGALNRGYARLLRRALHRRMDVVMVTLFAMGSMVVPAMNVRCVNGENFGTRRVTVRYAMPSDTTLEEAKEFFSAVEAMLERRADELSVQGQYIGYSADRADVQVFFDDPEPGQPSFDDMARAVVDALPERPGWRKTSQLGDSDGARDDSFRVALYGSDHESVQKARDELEEALLRVEGVIGVHDSGTEDRSRDELSLTLSREMSERFGVPATVVANTVAYTIRGAPLPRYHTDEREVDVRIRYRKADREDVRELMSFPVSTMAGDTVPIAVLADRRVTKGEASLQRFNKRVSALVRLDLDPDDREPTVDRLRTVLRGYQLPEGLSFDADHESRRVDEMQRDLTGALGLGTIFILLLMGFLFESFVLPLSVLPSIPLSFVGVYWFLYLTGENIDGLAGIGMVLLIGVVVNNAIVLIDFVNGARAQGLSRTEALVQAGRLRFRPIMMTALTTVGGMIPLAFSEPTGEGIPYGPFGKTLVGGMITSTVLTLLVVPVMYTFLDDLREAGITWWSRLRAMGRRRG